MRNFLIALVSLAAGLGSTAFGSGKMVYMEELANSKHVWIAGSQGNNPHRLTSGKAWHLYPTINASGTQVAFVSGNDEKNLDLIVEDLATGRTVKWTHGEGRHLHPNFSGNGRYLAVSGPYGADKSARIMIIDLAVAKPGDATTGRTVIPADAPCYFPALSSDGSFVIFQRSKDHDHRDIVKYDLAEKKMKALTPADRKSMSPSLSFDDRAIAYTMQDSGKDWNVYAQDLSSGKVERVTEATSNEFAPVFRPDGSLVFASDRFSTMQFFLVDALSMKTKEFKEKRFFATAGDVYRAVFSGDTAIKQNEMPPIPAPARSSFGAAKVGDKVYLFGGHAGHEHTYPKESFLANVEILDLKTRKWSAGAPRPMAAHGYSVAVSGKYVYAFGGFAYAADLKPSWRSLDEIDRYDTETNSWTNVGHLPRKRSSNVVARVGDNVYLIGGWDSTPKFPNDADGTFHAEIDVFNVVTEKVSTLAVKLPSPLRRAFSGIVRGDEILLVGGLGVGASHFALLDNVTSFRPETGEFKELPKLPFATFAPAAGYLKGELWMFGGMFKLGPEDYNYVSHAFRLPAGTTEWVHSGRYLREAKGFSQVVELDENTLGIIGGHAYSGNDDAPVPTFETFTR